MFLFKKTKYEYLNKMNAWSGFAALQAALKEANTWVVYFI